MIILGSGSPRRKEILHFFSIPFTQVTPTFDEEAVPFKGNPTEYVAALSEGKGESLAPCYPEKIILTADTLVFSEGKIFGKPKTEAEGLDYLASLVGKWHTVYSSVTLTKGTKKLTEVEKTKVLFNEFSSDDIKTYYMNLSCHDKAGAYAIQGPGAIIVKQIEGCFYNVMGLPVNALFRLLKSFGVNLMDFLT